MSYDSLAKCIKLATKSNFTTCEGYFHDVYNHPAYKLIQNTHTLYQVRSNRVDAPKLTVIADAEAQKRLIKKTEYTTDGWSTLPPTAIVSSRLIGFEGWTGYDYQVINYRKCGLIERFKNKHCTIFGTISNYSDETEDDLTKMG